MPVPRRSRSPLVGPDAPLQGRGRRAHDDARARARRGRARRHPRVVEPPLPVRALPGRAGGARRRPDVDAVPAHPARRCRWARPDTWVRTGRRLRDVDVIVVVHVIPAVVPAHLALLRAAGVGAHHPAGRGPRTVAHRAQRAAARGPPRRPAADGGVPRAGSTPSRPLRRAGPPRRRARRRTRRASSTCRRTCPAAPPRRAGRPRRPAAAARARHRARLQGRRPARRRPARRARPALTVAGEMWGDAGRAGPRAGRRTRALRGRVEVHGGYVPADRIAAAAGAATTSSP